MHIVHLTSEISRIAKAGGLGDVVYGLSKGLLKSNQRVDVILPHYDCCDDSNFEVLEVGPSFPVEEGAEIHQCTPTLVEIDGIRVHLIATDHPARYFSRGEIYGGVDEVRRFLFFSKAALEYLQSWQEIPNILHLHDWATAGALIFLRKLYPTYKDQIQKICLSLHNLHHQGTGIPADLHQLEVYDISREIYHDPIHPEKINVLQAGLYHADQIIAVSPNYAKEIQTKPGSCNLHKAIQENKKKLVGILNGIDTDYWNLAHEEPITKEELLQKLNMKMPSGPLVTAITRLVPQKGPALIKTAIEYTLENNGAFILLCTCQDPVLLTEFQALQKSYQNHPHLHMHFTFDEPLAHQTYLASDAIVIPSLFEPCGLTQLIAMHYGTVPIVRATGGLIDTIFEEPKNQRNGFLFSDPKPEALKKALERAFLTYLKEPTIWQKLIEQGKSTDKSWTKATEAYLQLYSS